MARWLEALRDAPVEDDYLGPVLFEDKAAIELFRQLAAPEIAGTPSPEQGHDALSDGDTPPTARIGRRLLPEGWSIVDDPAGHPDAAGGYALDFEGVPAQRVELVEDGVVRTVLMSRVPREDLVGSNGHGRSSAPRDATRFRCRRRRTGARRRDEESEARAAHGSPAGRDYVLACGCHRPRSATSSTSRSRATRRCRGSRRRTRCTGSTRTDERCPSAGWLLGVDRRALRDIVAAGKIGAPVGDMDSTPGPQQYTIGPVGGLPVTWSAPPVVIAEMELRGSTAAEPRVIPPPPRDAPLATNQ
jgi:hypothetical protein